MNEDVVISMGMEALKSVLFLAGPILVVTLIVGLLVSVFQAVTQINEATLTFIPKMIAIAVVLAVMGPWMLHIIQEYATHIFGNAFEWVR